MTPENRACARAQDTHWGSPPQTVAGALDGPGAAMKTVQRGAIRSRCASAAARVVPIPGDAGRGCANLDVAGNSRREDAATATPAGCRRAIRPPSAAGNTGNHRRSDRHGCDHRVFPLRHLFRRRDPAAAQARPPARASCTSRSKPMPRDRDRTPVAGVPRWAATTAADSRRTRATAAMGVGGAVAT